MARLRATWGGSVRARPPEPWAATLLVWRPVGAKLQAELSAARYFIFAGRYRWWRGASCARWGAAAIGLRSAALAACGRRRRRARRTRCGGCGGRRRWGQWMCGSRRRECECVSRLPRASSRWRGRAAEFNLPCMRAPKKKQPAGAKLRNWRVTILRQRGEHLGTIEAPDAKTAEAKAVKQFGLDGERRRRLAIREQRLMPPAKKARARRKPAARPRTFEEVRATNLADRFHAARIARVWTQGERFDDPSARGIRPSRLRGRQPLVRRVGRQRRRLLRHNLR
jgi:hypothetical protein